MSAQHSVESASPSLRRIPVDELAVGMFVEDVFSEAGVLLLSANAMIDSMEQVENLMRRGVRTVFINIAKGRDIPDDPVSVAALPDPVDPLEPLRRKESADREQAYFKELERARDVHRRSIGVAADALRAVRSGGNFAARDVRDAAEEMAASIIRNPDALVSLSQIKGYDEYTYVHSVNVGILTASLAHAMGYSADLVAEVGMGGLLHDVGKMRIPDAVLNKPGRLTESEFALVKRHPEMGFDVIRDRPGIPDVSRKLVLQHHERFNGGGYPFGLKGDRITEAGLIGAVADVYDALTSDRSYKKAYTPQKALAMIFSGGDTDYSRRIVDLFTRHLGIYPVGSFVRLASGEMGVVIRVDRGNLLHPVVKMLFDAQGRPLTAPLEYDLSVFSFGTDAAKYKIVISVDPVPFGVRVADHIGRPLL